MRAGGDAQMIALGGMKGLMLHALHLSNIASEVVV